MQLTARFSEMLGYATALHARQVRKSSGIPYIAHLLGVVAIAMEYGATEDEAIAVLLHDAIEDQGGARARRRYAGGSATRLSKLSMAARIPT